MRAVRGRWGRPTAVVAVFLVVAGLGGLCAIAGLGPVFSVAGAQAQDETEVRIVARRVAARGTEVALQQHGGEGRWGDRVSPSFRFVPDDSPVGRWWNSMPLPVETPSGKQWVRIVARRVAAGGTEVALQKLEASIGWGDRMLPELRFVSDRSRLGLWRYSSPLTIFSPTSPSRPAESDTPPPSTGSDPPLGLITPTGVPVAVIERTESGYLVRTPCGATAEVTTGRPIHRTRIVIDPGHGGWWDTGAVGPNGLVERDLNLTLSRAILEELTDRGITAVLTRTGNYGLPLSRRAEFADALEADALVSIHHNAPTWATSSKPGTEVYVQSVSRAVARADSSRLGGLLYQEITAALSGFDDVSWSGLSNAGVLRVLLPEGGDAYGMIRRPKLPAVLVEYGYLSNSSEAALFSTDRYIEVAADATADAIEIYLNTDRPGTGFVSQPRVFDPASAPTRCEEVPLE